MSVIGDKQTFAVEYAVADITSRHIYGHFAFWGDEQRIGNWNDVCDLSGVCSFCAYFVQNKVDRYQSTLAKLNKEEVFATVYDPEMVYKVTSLQPSFNIPDARSRFDISYLGMSSFADYFAVLLVQNGTYERLLWADLQDYSIQEVRFPVGTVVEVLEDFVSHFSADWNKL